MDRSPARWARRSSCREAIASIAVDFDGDGRIDLFHDNADVIGSVANYLARHDWLRGQPVLLPARIAPETRDAALRKLDGGISERRPLAAWQADGVDAVDAPSDLAADPVGLLMLEEPADNGELRASYWIACPNFYVITRYNKSRLYASAVFVARAGGEAAHARLTVSARSQRRSHDEPAPADDRHAAKDLPLKEDTRLLGRLLGDVLRAQTGDGGLRARRGGAADGDPFPPRGAAGSRDGARRAVGTVE